MFPWFVLNVKIDCNLPKNGMFVMLAFYSERLKIKYLGMVTPRLFDSQASRLIGAQISEILLR